MLDPRALRAPTAKRQSPRIFPTHTEGRDSSRSTPSSETSPLENMQHSPAPSPPQASLVLFSFVYGSGMYRDPVLRLFLKSIAGCGTRVIMLSTLNASASTEGITLPSNVHERRISWQGLASMLKNKFFEPDEPQGKLAFATAHPFKAHDIKPLLPLLFPGLVQGHDWWGWVDWDTWVGDLRRLQHFLGGYHADVWTPGMGLWKAWLPDPRCTAASMESAPLPGTVAGPSDCAQKISWGPLTVVRNSMAAYKRLWAKPFNRRAVRFMLQQDGNTQFDEWGEVAFAHKAVHSPLTAVGYANSFSGILLRASRIGTLRLLFETPAGLQADARRCRDDPRARPCLAPSLLRPGAGYCRIRATGSGTTRLFQGELSSNASASGCVCEREAVVCHFPFKGGRRNAWRRLDDDAMRTLLNARDLVATHDAAHPLGLYSVGRGRLM